MTFHGQIDGTGDDASHAGHWIVNRPQANIDARAARKTGLRIGLIDTLDKGSGGNGPNVGIAALSGYLTAHGHQVGILDLFHCQRRAERMFFESPWDLVGVSATSFDFRIGLEAAAEVKKGSGAPVVFGGAHASVARDELLRERAIDYAIYGEGEIPLLSLADALKAECAPDAAKLREIKGLIFRDGPEVIVNPAQPRMAELDSLPPPAYHLFPMDHYSEHHLSTSRGCPFACVYCASGAVLGKKWVGRSAESLVGEIEFLIRNFGKKTIVFVDDTFNLDVERVKRFCRLVIERRLDVAWLLMAGMRADRTDSEMLRLMKESGCMDIGVGIESANPEVLKNIAKGESIDDITRGIRLIKQAGFRTAGSFMIGNPGDTLETVKESLQYAVSQGIDDVMIYHAMPFPRTRLWEFVEKNGRFLRSDFVNFDKFIREPVFDTPEFPYADRVEAYRLAKSIFPSKHVDKEAGDQGKKKGIGHYLAEFINEVREHGYGVALKKTYRFLRRYVSSKHEGIGTRTSRPKAM